MTTTTFSAGTVVASTWLNDVNTVAYTDVGGPGVLSTSTGSTKVGFANTGTGAVTRTLSARLRDFISVKDFGALGDGTTDDAAALQLAINTGRSLYFPNGTYKIGTKLTLATSGQMLLGENERSVILKASAAITMFETQINVEFLTFKNLSFTSSVASATGVGTATTAGSFHDYMISPTFQNCHFYSDLAYGINSDFIFATVNKCTFGYYSNSSWASGMVGIKSYTVSSNYTNVNHIEDCRFKAGSTSVYALDLNGGNVWSIKGTDFEQGGYAIRADNLGNLSIEECWFESNSCSTAQVINLTPTGAAAGGGVSIRNSYFTNNTCSQIIQYQSSVLQFLDIKDCFFSLIGSSYPVYDGTSTSYSLLGSGQLIWRNNYVTGGSGSNKLVTGINKGMQNDVRGWAVINTAGSGSITASSDPGLSINRTGTGVVVVTWSHNNGTTSSSVCVQASGQTTIAYVGAAAASTCTITCKNDAGAATDDTFHVIVLGK